MNLYNDWFETDKGTRDIINVADIRDKYGFESKISLCEIIIILDKKLEEAKSITENKQK